MSSYKQKIAQLIVQLREAQECVAELLEVNDALHRTLHTHRYDPAYKSREDVVSSAAFKCAHCGSLHYKHTGEKFSDIECTQCGAEYTLMQWRGGVAC